MPAEEDLFPAGRDHAAQSFGRDPRDGDKSDRQRRDRQNTELQHLGDDHAEHAALHYVEGGDAHQDQRIYVGGKVPRQEIHREFADALEAVSEKSDHTDQRVDHHDHMRKFRAASGPEPRADPFGAGGHVGAAQPRGKINHQEDLVEDRPQPRDPNALQPVNEHQVDQPHGPGDIEHAGGVGDAQEVPGQDVAAQVVRLGVARGTVRDPIAEQHGRRHVDHDDRDIDRMQFHLETSVPPHVARGLRADGGEDARFGPEAAPLLPIHSNRACGRKSGRWLPSSAARSFRLRSGRRQVRRASWRLLACPSRTTLC